MILITEFMDEAAVETLKGNFEIVYNPALADHQDDIPAMMENVRALIVRNRTRVTDELLSNAPQLSCIGRLGVGLDNIDVVTCERRGVSIYPATGANNVSVAEYVVTAALTLLRGAWYSKHAMLAGEWPRRACVGREIGDKSLGLIGFGAIARDTARLAQGLGMKILAHDPFVNENDSGLSGVNLMSFDEVLEQSDVISLHVPLAADTWHLIDGEAISRMKPHAILINAARGGVVDEKALSATLKSGRLAGAALDVFETEPLTAEAAKRFSGIPNLILTPHIAGVTEESNVRVSSMIAETVLKHLQEKR